VRAAVAGGLPVSAVAGLRFALEPGRARRSAPVRSVIVGAVLAIIVVTATLTFGASLNTLISHPSLYGWNFNYALYSTDGYGPIPTKVSGSLLAHDHQVVSDRRVLRDGTDRRSDDPGHGRAHQLRIGTADA
jgi:hypothetical protein